MNRQPVFGLVIALLHRPHGPYLLADILFFRVRLDVNVISDHPTGICTCFEVLDVLTEAADFDAEQLKADGLRQRVCRLGAGNEGPVVNKTSLRRGLPITQKKPVPDHPERAAVFVFTKRD